MTTRPPVDRAGDGIAAGLDVSLADRFVRLLGVGAEAHEVRVVFSPTDGAKRVLSGAFDAPAKLTREIRPWAAKAHCFITLNPLALEGGVPNRLSTGRAATDAAILRRAWLLVDIDADRPEGLGDHCTTEAELANALGLRDEIADVLRREIGAGGIRLCSGNGGTILYRLPDRGVDDAMVKRALTGLATRFDRPGAHVDQAVTNASRLTRIAGTWNVKREAPGRSRRMVRADCELADAPAPISLDALVALLPAAHETRLKPLSAARPRGGGPAAPIPEGRRNTSLMALAGFLRRDGWEHEGIQTALTAINGTCCKPPLPESELNGIAGRAAGYEAPEGAEVLEPVFIRLEDVKAEPVRWLWPGYLPLGKLVILDGDPGLGKSVLSLDLAARVTTGRAMPDGQDGTSGGVVILSAEDAPGDTIRPRLDAAGADPTRVRILRAVRGREGEHSPEIVEPADLAGIERAVRECDARLLIFDPLTAFLGGRVNANYDQDVRRALGPLTEMAQRAGVTIIAIRHLNKSQGISAIYRGGGSIGITGASRAAFMVGKDPSDPQSRVFANVKANLSRLSGSLGFRVETAPSGVPCIRWTGASSVSANDRVQPEPSAPARPRRDEAQAFLLEVLANGPALATEVLEGAEARGIRRKTLDRAKKELGVRVGKPKGVKDGPWEWHLPERGHSPGNGHLPASAGLAEDRSASNYGELDQAGEDGQPVEDRQTQIAFAEAPSEGSDA